MYKSRNMFNLYEKTTILDPVLFKKKFNFFYDTSFDILFKGEFSEESNKLSVFSESHKASRNVSLNKQLATKQEHKVSNSKSNGFLMINESKRNHLTLAPGKHKPFTHPIALHLTQPHPSKGSLRKSHSQKTIVPKHLGRYSKTIKDLDKILSQLNIAINKEKDREYFNVLKGSFNDEREKIISLFSDYLHPDIFQKAKNRYNDLFRKDTYFKRIKSLKQKAELAGCDKHKLTPSQDEDPLYVNMLNNIPFANRQSVKTKYSSIGRVKVLNLPKEISEQEIETDKLLKRKNVVIDNVNSIYACANKATQKQLDYCAKLSQGNSMQKRMKTKQLAMINSKSNDLERDTALIKKSIINMRTQFQCQYPLLNKKVFAYIEDSHSDQNKPK